MKTIDDTEEVLTPGELQHEVSQLVENLSSACQQLGQVSAVSTTALGDLLERCAASLEELRTLKQISDSEIATAKEAATSIESKLYQFESIFKEIDKVAEFVHNKKQQLSELENLCTLVENSAKGKLNP